MKNVALHNLGCKVNSYEIEVMQQKLQEKGYNIVPFDSVADIYIVNTCTVTNIADRKSRQMLHRAKQMNPDAVVVAVGCYVQTGGENAKQDKGIDLLVGNNKKKDIVEILESYLARRATVVENTTDHRKNGAAAMAEGTAATESGTAGNVDKTLGGTTVLDINHTYEYEEMQLESTAEHTRAYIKIQDGCNQFCSYCAIPYARGRVRSRRAEDILKEVSGIVDKGYQEVVLTGIHISSYGIDFDEQEWNKGNSVRVQGKLHPEYTGSGKLIDLVERIAMVPGLKRIRLGSLEPRIVTEETAKRLAAIDILCPHFHLSLQSGCDETLKRMNRHYTTKEYAESVKNLRQAFDNPAITTDVIVGFPGETEEEFEQTEKFLEMIQFYEMHIFKYSKRAGTPAATMKEQVPEPVKTIRSNRLLEMEKRHSKEFRKHLLGKQASVLLEEMKEIEGKKYWIGHTKDYVKAALSVNDGLKSNQILPIRMLTLLQDDILLGEQTDTNRNSGMC